jgi:hypothetical protein
VVLVYIPDVADSYAPKAATRSTVGTDACRLQEGLLGELCAVEEAGILDHGSAVELAGYALQARHLEWREEQGQEVEPRWGLDLAELPITHQ